MNQANRAYLAIQALGMGDRAAAIAATVQQLVDLGFIVHGFSCDARSARIAVNHIPYCDELRHRGEATWYHITRTPAGEALYTFCWPFNGARVEWCQHIREVH